MLLTKIYYGNIPIIRIYKGRKILWGPSFRFGAGTDIEFNLLARLSVGATELLMAENNISVTPHATINVSSQNDVSIITQLNVSTVNNELSISTSAPIQLEEETLLSTHSHLKLSTLLPVASEEHLNSDSFAALNISPIVSAHSNQDIDIDTQSCLNISPSENAHVEEKIISSNNTVLNCSPAQYADLKYGVLNSTDSQINISPSAPTHVNYNIEHESDVRLHIRPAINAHIEAVEQVASDASLNIVNSIVSNQNSEITILSDTDLNIDDSNTLDVDAHIQLKDDTCVSITQSKVSDIDSAVEMTTEAELQTDVIKTTDIESLMTFASDAEMNSCSSKVTKQEISVDLLHTSILEQSQQASLNTNVETVLETFGKLNASETTISSSRDDIEIATTASLALDTSVMSHVEETAELITDGTMSISNVRGKSLLKNISLQENTALSIDNVDNITLNNDIEQREIAVLAPDNSNTSDASAHMLISSIANINTATSPPAVIDTYITCTNESSSLSVDKLETIEAQDSAIYIDSLATLQPATTIPKHLESRGSIQENASMSLDKLPSAEIISNIMMLSQSILGFIREVRSSSNTNVAINQEGKLVLSDTLSIDLAELISITTDTKVDVSNVYSLQIYTGMNLEPTVLICTGAVLQAFLDLAVTMKTSAELHNQNGSDISSDIGIKQLNLSQLNIPAEELSVLTVSTELKGLQEFYIVQPKNTSVTATIKNENNVILHNNIESNSCINNMIHLRDNTSLLLPLIENILCNKCVGIQNDVSLTTCAPDNVGASQIASLSGTNCLTPVTSSTSAPDSSILLDGDAEMLFNTIVPLKHASNAQDITITNSSILSFWGLPLQKNNNLIIRQVHNCDNSTSNKLKIN